MTLEAVVFDDWKGGEYGLLSPRDAGKKPGTFAGKNVMRYPDGLLGPRPGLRAIGITGLGNGKIKSLGGGSVGTVVVIDSTVYSFDPTSYGSAATAWTMTDSITDAVTKPAEMQGTFATEYVLCYGGSAYKLVNSTKVCTRIAAGGTNMPPGRCSTYYQDRIIIGGTAAAPSRLFFSEPGAAGWETFPAVNFYDLPGLAITHMVPFRSGLLVAAGGAFVYITGTLGASAVVRVLSTQGAPADTAKAAKLDSDEIVYMHARRPYPARYNGALHKLDKHLRFAGYGYAGDTSETPTYGVHKLVGPDDWLFLSGRTVNAPDPPENVFSRALLHHDDVSSYHTFGINYIGAWSASLGDGREILVKDGTAGTPPQFFMFFTELFRPAFTTDTDSRPGDDSTTPLDAYIHIPQYWDPDGQEMLVREVIVDFKKWDTGSPSNNHFDLTVRAVNRYNIADVVTSSTQAFDELGSAAAAVIGTDDRRNFYVGDQGQGGGFEIFLDAIKGVAIRSVTVRFERLPPR